MAKDPAFLFYSSDFLTGTFTMSDEEVGKYVRLLCLQHQSKGSIPRNAFNTLCNGHESVREKFVEDDDGYYNERLREESAKRNAYCESRKSNRTKHMKNICETYDTHMENENVNENVNENRNKKNVTIIVNSDKLFNQLYKQYPKKVGKKAAMRHFRSSVKTENDQKDIQIALKHYLESKRVMNGYIQNASTWFNNWQDWVDFEEKICPKCKGKGFFISSTGYEIKCECGANK